MQMLPGLAVVALAGLNSGLAAAAEPAAGGATKVAVLPPVLSGEVAPELGPELEQTIVSGLERGNFGIIPPSEVTAASPGAASCADTQCAAGVARDLGAAFALWTVVNESARNYEINLELVDASNGETLASGQETCEICGLAEVGEMAAGTAAKLKSQVDMLARGPGKLRVVSEPEGAEVTLDGAVVGKTPLELEVDAGEHVVGVKKEGHGNVERQVEAAMGVTETVSFRLDRTRGGWYRKKEPWGWIAVGVGVATLGGGAALLAIDERPYRKNCSGKNVDDAGTCRFRYNTLGGGVAMALVGAGLIATGVALVIIDRKGQKNGSRVRAGLTPGGVLLSGEF